MKMIQIRYLQVVLLFLGNLLCFSMRVNMSVAIVDMTDKHNEGAFNWSMQTQSVILSSFLWGYVVLQIPSGELAVKFGGHILLLICVGINAVLTLLIPTVAYVNWKALCTCRILQGLSQGLLFPTQHNLISKWVPLNEKSRLGTLIYGGCYLGTSLQLMASGLIADIWGWPSIFYVNGTAGAIWVVIYLFLGSDSPQKSKMISNEERLYIQTSLGQVGEQKKLKTPWRNVFTSVPFIALIIVHCGYNWGFWTLLMQMSSYMGQALGVDIKSNGLMSGLPYLVMYLLTFPVGFTSDYLIKKNWCSVSTCRKVCNSIGTYGSAIFLIVLCHAPVGSVPLAVGLLTLVVGLNAGPVAGYLLVHIDMAPNFAGTLMGITNCIANTVGFVAPLTAGAIVKDETDPKQWHIVFYIASAIYTVTNTIFVVFGTSKRQAWNNPKEDHI